MEQKPKPDNDKLARIISESAHQIWSAGIGALTIAEKEGSKFFESLAKLGESIEAGTRKTASAAKQTVSGGRNTATETWDKLEEMFELRVARALNALQIPTARDIKELTRRVDKLSKAVDELDRKKTATRKKKSGTGKKKSRKKKKDGKKKGKKKKKKTGRRPGN